MLTSDPITTIAIVGAGFSGCLVAVHLLKTANRPLLIELIERDRDIGKGALKNGMSAAIDAERNRKYVILYYR
jgi:2-polyprenyl-6-methoxyphenol hydroxylase-like FAD-dependent oxidoreductase